MTITDLAKANISNFDGSQSGDRFEQIRTCNELSLRYRNIVTIIVSMCSYVLEMAMATILDTERPSPSLIGTPIAEHLQNGIGIVVHCASNQNRNHLLPLHQI